jgi:flavorubredoxin
VRWVFLTHDDHDHAGNLRQVMDACPNAMLVTTWFSMGRYAIDSEDFWMPFDRVRWVRDGESFQAGDRTLVAVYLPFFDNPTTRGLLDTTTRVYWSVGRRERRCCRTWRRRLAARPEGEARPR